ncbi:hypothetical protein PMAYCL1PPCAC_24472, partial [Pristionchus mayeri]
VPNRSSDHAAVMSSGDSTGAAAPLKPVSANQLQRRKSLNAPRIAGLYDLERTIGQGHFAVVKLARHVFTGEQVAVKVIDKTNLDPVSTTHLMQEVRCMKLVQHPNIVRLYEVIDTATKLFLILELGDYDMHDFIAKHEKGCPEPIAQQFFSQIITAINYCHKLHVVHRDLKPENVVFFEKLGMVKLTDFGFSNLYEPGEQLRTSCGSLAYSAPEILLGDAYDAPAVDVWSLGVILFMLVTGRLPFQETNDSETLTKILDCRFSLPDSLSNPCKNLISRMLVRDPAKRSTLEEIAASPWVIAGERGHADVLPLVVRHHLPDSAHTTIIEQMVNGRIGSEDEIVSSLENGEYNYLSATYYLLAERVLSSYREQAARELAEKEAACSVPDETPPEGERGAGDCGRGGGGQRCRSRSNSFRASVRRPCSILKEESEEELSSYLRSSRQSSRFYLSRDNSSASSLADERDDSSGIGSHHVHTTGGGTTVLPSLSRPTSTEHLTVPSSPRGLGPSVGGGGTRGSGSSFYWEDLSPIAEGVERKEEVEKIEEKEEPRERMEEIEEEEEEEPKWRELRSGSAAPFGRVGSGRRTKGAVAAAKLIRRNSSPSVSMFGGGGVSSRDRVSPQALQELLELTRLSGRRAASPDSIRSSRSPSPPGSSASGRTSPATSMLSRLKTPSVVLGGGGGGTPGSGGSGSSGGMRKLSSSPHLLGICEEGEEENGSQGDTLLTEGHARQNRSASTTGVTVFLGGGDGCSSNQLLQRRDSSDSSSSSHRNLHHHRSSSGHGHHHHQRSLLRTSSREGAAATGGRGTTSQQSTQHVAAAAATNPLSPLRTTPVRPTTIVTPSVSPPSAAAAATAAPRMMVTKDTKTSSLTTYSAVRMIRPRQAVVSPDVCRRYEQHARFVTRSRRSTSCSSSETSDDEERRLTMLSSSRCKRGGDERKDDEGGGGGSGGGLTGNGSALGNAGKNSMRGTAGGGERTEGGEKREGGGERNKKAGGGTCESVRSSCEVLSSPLTPLHPIPEMTQLHADKHGRRRARLLYRSATAERVVAEWATAGVVLQQPAAVASAPRTAAREEKGMETTSWLRSIMRTRSVEDERRKEQREEELSLSSSLPSAATGGLAAAAAASSRSSSKSKTVYSSASPSDSSLSDLFSPSESEDSGLSFNRRKRLTKKKQSRSRKEEGTPVAIVEGKSHLEQWIDQLCVV